MDLSLLKDGFTVLLIGFSMVFFFLCILIFSMGIMARVIEYLNKVFPVQVQASVPVKKSSSNEEEEIAVALAAVFAK